MKQAEKIYMISDAAKQVEVEAHVLRYWEEELEVPAKRNEMGHRYYTEEDIRRFIRIKELKEQGLQLKAIRHMLKSGDLQTPVMLFEKSRNTNGQGMEGMSQEAVSGEMDMGKRHVLMVKKGEILPVDEKTVAMQEESREQKSFRLQQLLKDMIAEAVQSNNQEICQEIKDTLLKELDYQFRLQEEKEDARDEERISRQEEHYHQIDELIRSYAKRGKRGRRVRKDNSRKESVKKENLKNMKKENMEAEEPEEEDILQEEMTREDLSSKDISDTNKEIPLNEDIHRENLWEEDTQKENGEQAQEMANEEIEREKSKSKGFFPKLFSGKKRPVV